MFSFSMKKVLEWPTFTFDAGPDGRFPVEQAAGLLAMHCMVRGQSTSDYIVMVQPKTKILDDLKEKADSYCRRGNRSAAK